MRTKSRNFATTAATKAFVNVTCHTLFKLFIPSLIVGRLSEKTHHITLTFKNISLSVHWHTSHEHMGTLILESKKAATDIKIFEVFNRIEQLFL